MTKTYREMLLQSRNQFAYYADNHEAKVANFSKTIIEYEDSNQSITKAVEIILLEQAIADTLLKAAHNREMVNQIDAVLAQPETNVLQVTADFAKIAYADGVSSKNQQTQIGVHFEEVAEMMTEIGSNDPWTEVLLSDAFEAVNALGEHLKTSAPSIQIKSRLKFLDAVCDQLVTATLSAALYDMDPVGGLVEVNRSNYSKLVDGVMQKAPVTAKWIKGPDYSDPDLTPFI